METERLILVLEKIKELLNDDYFTRGICSVIEYIGNKGLFNLTTDEFLYVQNYIDKNRPTYDNGFKNCLSQKHFWVYDKNGYWWTPMYLAPETRKLRIIYMEILITKTKKFK